MIVLQLSALIGLLPTSDVLAERLVALFRSHGLPLVAVASFAENLAGFGTYFPGSVALVLAMTLTAGDPIRASLTYVAVVLPAIVANILSFLAGRSRSKNTLHTAAVSTQRLWVWYASTYWHPQLAGVTALAAGSSGVTLRRHVATFLPVSVAWSILWAIVLYSLGQGVSVPRALAPGIYIYLLGWILWDLRKFMRSNRR